MKRIKDKLEKGMLAYIQEEHKNLVSSIQAYREVLR
jgi:hypothetical protein